MGALVLAANLYLANAKVVDYTDGINLCAVLYAEEVEYFGYKASEMVGEDVIFVMDSKGTSDVEDDEILVVIEKGEE